MKNLFKIFILLILYSLSKNTEGQNSYFSIYNKGAKNQMVKLEIDTIYYSSSTICNISDSYFSGLALSADIELYSYESYIRIILVDLNDGREYLVYDAYYPMNKISTKYSIEEFTYEANMLYNISNAVVKAEIYNAECFVKNIVYSTNLYSNKDRFYAAKDLQKHRQDSILVNSVNKRIANDSMIWIAGNTSISNMFYDERKNILPKNSNNEIPNLQGLEYYTGGVFVVYSDLTTNLRNETSDYVDDFDWRDRHGTSWITPSKYNHKIKKCIF